MNPLSRWLFPISGLAVAGGALLSGFAPADSATLVAAGGVIGGIAQNIWSGLLQEKIGRWRASPESLFANGDLRNLAAEAITQTLRRVKAEKGKYEEDPLGHLVAQVGPFFVKEYEALITEGFAALRDQELPQAVLGYIGQGEKAQVCSLDEWADLLQRTSDARGFHLSEGLRQRAAEELHRSFAHAVYELVKEDAAGDGKTYAAVALSLQQRTLDLLEKLDARDRLPLVGDIEKFAQFHSAALVAFSHLAEVRQIATRSLDLLGQLADGQTQLLGGQGEILRVLFELQETVAARESRAQLADQRPWHPPALGDWFLGREAELAQVVAALRAHRRVVLHGPGGVGKTSLAAHSLHAMASGRESPGAYPGGIFSHDYYRQPSHVAALTSLVEQSGRRTGDFSQLDSAVTQMFGGWDRLVYLEGCERAEDLGALLCLLGDTRVLLTTRDAEHAARGHAFRVPPLPAEEGPRLIHCHAQDGGAQPDSNKPGDWKPWRSLSAFLGHHPLACQRAGIILRLDGDTPTQLLAALEAEGVSVLRGDDTEKENLAFLFQHDVIALADGEPEALVVWHTLALGALAPLHVAPLAAGAGLEGGRVVAALKSLERRGLCHWEKMPGETIGQEEKGWVLTHALLAEYGRRELPAIAAVRLIGGFSPEKSMQRWWDWWHDFSLRAHHARTVPGGYLGYAALRAHLEAIPTRMEASGWGGLPGLALSQYQVARLHDLHGELASAESFYRRALAVREKVFGFEHPDTLSSVSSLAVLLRVKGDLAGAEPFYRRAFTGREKVLGAEHPDTLCSVNGLAILLRAKGDLEGAEPFYRRAFTGREKVLGAEHPDTLSSVNNFAFLLQAKGNLTEAEAFCRRALSGRKKVLGIEHPDTLNSINNLGFFLHSKGDLNGAEPLYRQALTQREKVLGSEHPDTLVSVSNLSLLLHAKGDLAGAEPFCRQALAKREKVLGAEHPDTLVSVNNLAGLLDSRGEFSEAEALYSRVFFSRKKMLGAEHPKTCQSAFHLAHFLKNQGRQTEIGDMAKQAYEGLKTKLGETHAWTKKAAVLLQELIQQS